MRILGRSGSTYKPSFIVEISEEEMKELTGHDETRYGTGANIQIRKSIRRLKDIDDQPAQRAKIATQLRAMAEIIEAIPPMVIHDEQPKEGGDA